MNLERDTNITVKNCTLIGHQYCMLDMHFCYKKKFQEENMKHYSFKTYLALHLDALMVISDELRSPHHANTKGRLHLIAWFGSGLLRWVLLSSRSPQNHWEQRMTLTSCSSRPCCLSARMTSVCCCAWPAGRSFFYFLLYLFVVSLSYDASDFCLPYPNAVKQEICLRAGICKYLTNEL